MSLFTLPSGDVPTQNVRQSISFRIKKTKWYAQKHRTYVVGGLFLICVILYVGFIGAPRSFPVGTTVDIPKGTTVSEAANLLDEGNIIHSRTAFKVLMSLVSRKGVYAGQYFFERPHTLFGVVHATSRGNYGFTPLVVTIPEGLTVVEIAVRLERVLGGFDAEHFISIALPYEGYLFPDTYFFLPNVDEEEVLRVMREHFDTQINSILGDIHDFGKSLEEVVIMASLLEKEARLYESKRMISDILWSRLDIGMALQVDAVFPYIIGRNTYELTLEDLEYDSPYNTYKYPGLPIGPIANPGIDSLRAAIDPKPNDYLFYLSDDNGDFHYARTFEQHIVNKNKYLR